MHSRYGRKKERKYEKKGKGERTAEIGQLDCFSLFLGADVTVIYFRTIYIYI